MLGAYILEASYGFNKTWCNNNVSALFIVSHKSFAPQLQSPIPHRYVSDSYDCDGYLLYMHGIKAMGLTIHRRINTLSERIDEI